MNENRKLLDCECRSCRSYDTQSHPPDRVELMDGSWVDETFHQCRDCGYGYCTYQPAPAPNPCPHCQALQPRLESDGATVVCGACGAILYRDHERRASF